MLGPGSTGTIRVVEPVQTPDAPFKVYVVVTEGLTVGINAFEPPGVHVTLEAPPVATNCTFALAQKEPEAGGVVNMMAVMVGVMLTPKLVVPIPVQPFESVPTAV